MNSVSGSDVTLLSMAIGFFTTAGTTLVNHDYFVAGGLALLGVLTIYFYHKFGSQTSA